MEKNNDVFGIGSALMDFLVEVKEELIEELNLKKGQFNLIEEERSKKIFEKIKEYNIKKVPGGSGANTLYAIALLGGKVGFLGKIGNDENAVIYEEKMNSSGVKTKLGKCNLLTGHAITFITPDKERTFAVNLGAATKLREEDLEICKEEIKSSKILHIEGYLFDEEELSKTAQKAMKTAKENNVLVSLDLADPGVVERNKEKIIEVSEKYADIIFANEEEAKALTGFDAKEALEKISEFTKIAIVKIGENGSFIKKKGEITQIPGYKAKAVDTTGAGDMFAAGVLYGIIKDYSMNIAGNIGSYYASKVVERIGARLDNIDKEELNNLIEKCK